MLCMLMIVHTKTSNPWILLPNAIVPSDTMKNKKNIKFHLIIKMYCIDSMDADID